MYINLILTKKMEDNLTTKEIFESAVTIVRNLPKEGPIKPSDELKLKLYAYFKQATHGPNDTPKPRFYQIVEAYKWEAWRKLGDMSREDAMMAYICELKAIMDSMPGYDKYSPNSQHFEDVLGKKFYDYCKSTVSPYSQLLGDVMSPLSKLSRNVLTIHPNSFLGFTKWNEAGRKQQLKSMALDPSGETARNRKSSRVNDTQSNSSSGSSMSMLEETQSAGDGYKTPNSLAFKDMFTGDMSDQFAEAVLRLQHGLDETRSRLGVIENRLEQTVSELQLVAEQAHVKGTRAGSLRNERSLGPSQGCIKFLINITPMHWFYLSYPFLVFLFLRALERRNRSSSRGG